MKIRNSKKNDDVNTVASHKYKFIMYACKHYYKNILKLILLTISVLNYVNQMPINPYLWHINSLFSIKFSIAYVCV